MVAAVAWARLMVAFRYVWCTCEVTPAPGGVGTIFHRHAPTGEHHDHDRAPPPNARPRQLATESVLRPRSDSSGQWSAGPATCLVLLADLGHGRGVHARLGRGLGAGQLVVAAGASRRVGAGRHPIRLPWPRRSTSADLPVAEVERV